MSTRKLIEPIVGVAEVALIMLGDFFIFDGTMERIGFGFAVAAVMVMERLSNIYSDKEDER